MATSVAKVSLPNAGNLSADPNLGAFDPNLYSSLSRLKEEAGYEEKVRRRVGTFAEKSKHKYSEYFSMYFKDGIDGVVLKTDQVRTMDKLVAESSDVMTFQKIWKLGCATADFKAKDPAQCRTQLLNATIFGQDPRLDLNELSRSLNPFFKVFLTPYVPPLFTRSAPQGNMGYDARYPESETTQQGVSTAECGQASGAAERHPLQAA